MRVPLVAEITDTYVASIRHCRFQRLNDPEHFCSCHKAGSKRSEMVVNIQTQRL